MATTRKKKTAPAPPKFHCGQRVEVDGVAGNVIMLDGNTKVRVRLDDGRAVVSKVADTTGLPKVTE